MATSRSRRLVRDLEAVLHSLAPADAVWADSRKLVGQFSRGKARTELAAVVERVAGADGVLSGAVDTLPRLEAATKQTISSSSLLKEIIARDADELAVRQRAIQRRRDQWASRREDVKAEVRKQCDTVDAAITLREEELRARFAVK